MLILSPLALLCRFLPRKHKSRCVVYRLLFSNLDNHSVYGVVEIRPYKEDVKQRKREGKDIDLIEDYYSVLQLKEGGHQPNNRSGRVNCT